MNLYEKLPPISNKQKEWAFENSFPWEAYLCKGEAWCSMCGKSFEYTSNSDLGVKFGIGADVVCPHCGRELKLKATTKKKIEEDCYFTIVTTIGGWQVLRHYIVEKWAHKDRVKFKGVKNPQYQIREAVQNWLDEKGNEVVVARPRRGLSNYCYDKWIFTKPMEIRRKVAQYSYQPDPYTVEGSAVYPYMSVLPIYRRNGLKGKLPDVNLKDLMKMIVKDTRAETLLKAKQFELFRKLHLNGNMTHWHSALIAIRNKYIVEDADMWMDMLHALDYLGKDTHNAHYVCPDNLRVEHNKWVAMKRKREEKIEEKRKREQALYWEKEYAKEKGRFFGLEITNGRITIRTIQSVKEMQEEGDKMHHCVGSMDYYKRSDSLILSAKDDAGRRLETIEVSLKTMRVVQCFGAFNKKTENHDEILALMQNNMNLIIEAYGNDKKAG